ncbi:MAG TPA: DUF4249 family protein [Phaeodactylibacter sp.]|nr:DUF4249 family protein [Phaeodactylibacter sp.]
MKNTLLLLAIVATALFYPSCSNDIDLTAEWKDIPIVYGLISKNDTASYIRIQKAFLDNSTSALEIAQNPDSLYYDQLSVKIKGLENSTSYDLYRVDGNAEGYVREGGIFADSPNYLYKLKLPAGESLAGGKTYELEINRGDHQPLVTATTTIVSDIEIRKPDTDPSTANPINWVQSGLKVSWRAARDAHIFDLTVFLNIEEKDASNPNNDRVLTLDWKLDENRPAELTNSGVNMNTRLTKLDLFQYLNSHLEQNPNINRKVLSIDILVAAGGEALSEYISVGNANTGITSTQVIPTYTNLSEGFGIFSSKTTALQKGYLLHSETIDSLRENNLTKNLNFQF